MPGEVNAAFPVTVLKFGGSVLAREHDLARAVHEVYRWVREGHRVVAVVSALGKTTDRLLAQAHHYGAAPEPAALAALVATGEQTSAALLGLALDRAGVPAEVLDAARIELRTSGSVLDAEPVGVNAAAVCRALERVPVVVVPGFLGRDEAGRTTLLGRGGSDFSALFLAHALGAERCRLVKDVRGLYERDPARPGPLARVFRELSWDECLKLDGRIVQHKAVRWAKERGVRFEVASLNGTRASRVGPYETSLGPTDAESAPPLRVGLLGLGTVGGGVYRALSTLPELFEVTRIAVRNVKRAADSGVPAYLLTDDPASVVVSGCDLIVEAIGGIEPARELVTAALSNGQHVVTANKSLIAAHGRELAAIAEEHGVRLLYAAAVGGAVPVLEAVQRIAEGADPIDRIEAVLNGTSNFVLDRLAEGVPFEEAVRAAQAAGFAEADPTKDLDGTDAAEKLALVARAAFGRLVEAGDVQRRGLLGAGGTGPGEFGREPGRETRLVARAERGGEGGLRLEVRPIELEPGHRLALTRGERNRVVVTLRSGVVVEVHGKGAGRWPTAESVVGDLLELARERGETSAWRATARSGRNGVAVAAGGSVARVEGA